MLLVVILIGIFHGYGQGMTMLLPSDKNNREPELYCGVRNHRAFRYYHIINLSSYLLTILFGYLLRYSWQGFDFLALALLVAWMFAELFYSYARYATFIPESENILGLGLVANGKGMVIALHIFRTLFIILLLFI
jgi:hypothetical protein